MQDLKHNLITTVHLVKPLCGKVVSLRNFNVRFYGPDIIILDNIS